MRRRNIDFPGVISPPGVGGFGIAAVNIVKDFSHKIEQVGIVVPTDHLPHAQIADVDLAAQFAVYGVGILVVANFVRDLRHDAPVSVIAVDDRNIGIGKLHGEKDLSRRKVGQGRYCKARNKQGTQYDFTHICDPP
jgi:hypothetical protein